MDTVESTPAGITVVGVDGSESASRALEWATHQAFAEARSLRPGRLTR